ncbi:MAG TPA: energy transducer TonB [Chryseosolibacter sp.]
MKYLTLSLILALFGVTNSVAQQCADVIMTMNKDNDQAYYKFRQQISLDDEKWQLALTVDAVTDNKSIIMVLIANPPHCFKKGDSIDFTLNNGRTFSLRNILDDNCEQRVAAAFDLANGPNMLLDSLVNRDLASITVHSNGKKIKGDLRTNRKPVLKSSLQCLRDVLTSGTALQSFQEGEGNRVFMVVEQQPEFSGGYDQMKKFIKDNLKNQKGKGTVYVTFIVEKDGTLSEPKVLRSMSPAADKEALRVVTMMPKWTPGMMRGKPVRVRFNLPIKFE